MLHYPVKLHLLQCYFPTGKLQGFSWDVQIQFGRKRKETLDIMSCEVSLKSRVDEDPNQFQQLM